MNAPIPPLVLSAQIAHETNRFSRRPTTLVEFAARQLLHGDEIPRALAGTRTEIAAHIDAAQRHGWCLLQPLAAAATPSGPVSAEARRHFTDTILQACEQSPPAGVLLALHGAMVCEDDDDPEGNLLAALRERLGPAVPIVATVDLHANISDRMAAALNGLVTYRSYPHVDQYEVAEEAAELLARLLRAPTAALPGVSVARAPMLIGLNEGRTADGPMPLLLSLAERLREETPGIDAIAICAGFPWSDVFEAGPSISVSGSAPEATRRQLANALMELAEHWRDWDTLRAYRPKAALAEARRLLAEGVKPVVLADYTDNPGHGGYGDAVGLLRALLEDPPGNTILGCIFDPHTVVRCQQAGVGAALDLSLGAWVAPGQNTPPLALRAQVLHLSDGRFRCEGPMTRGAPQSLGPTAVIGVGEIRVVVISHNVQVFDRAVFTSQGLDPAQAELVVLKSAHHFRAAFEPIAGAVLMVDADGVVSRDLASLPFRHVRRPAWPVDALPARAAPPLLGRVAATTPPPPPTAGDDKARATG